MNEDHRSKAQTTQRDSFVVRIWRERGQPGWRGWVQHAATGETASVRRIDELLAFIEERAGRLAEPDRKGLK